MSRQVSHAMPAGCCHEWTALLVLHIKTWSSLLQRATSGALRPALATVTVANPADLWTVERLMPAHHSYLTVRAVHVALACRIVNRSEPS
jgi:hypothetical protein